MSRDAVLGGIGYTVTEADGQVIFKEQGGVWGTFNEFAFEKTTDINETPGIWYFVHMESSSERVPANHIAQAYEYCCERYGKNFKRKEKSEN